MALTIGGVATARGTISSPTAIGLPSGIAVGDREFMIWRCTSTQSLSTATAGWFRNFVITDTDASYHLEVWSRPHLTGNGSTTWTPSASLSATSGRFWARDDVSGLPPYPSAILSSGVAASGSTFVAPDVDPTASASLLLSYYSGVFSTGADTTADITPPVGQTEEGLSLYNSSTGFVALLASEVLASGSATGTRTATSTGTPTNSTNRVGLSIVLEPARTKMSTLFDNFASEDNSKWVGYNVGNGIVVSGGKLVETPTTSYHALISDVPYEFTGSGMFIELVTPPSSTGGVVEAVFSAFKDSSNRLDFAVGWNGSALSLDANYRVDGVTNSAFSGSYTHASQRWLRITELNGTIFWQTSPDAIAWTTVGSVANPFTVNALYPMIWSGYFNTPTGIGNVEWDNFNTGLSPIFLSTRGTVNSLVSQASTDVDLADGADIPIGNYLVARVAADNSGTSGAASSLTITESATSRTGSNTWTIVGPANRDPGLANEGTTVWIAYAKVDHAYLDGSDISFNWSPNTVAKSIVIEEWTNISATNPVAVAATTTTGLSTTPSISRTPTAANQVFYGALGIEGPSTDTYTQDADTTDGTWRTLTDVSTASGTAASNQTIRGGAKKVTGTSAQTWNPTITSRDWAMVALVFSPPGPIATRPLFARRTPIVRASVR